MAAKQKNHADTSGREIVQQRLFNAPRELVFQTFTDPKHISHWWGPYGFTTTTSKMEFKVGGIWKYVMHGPDGHDYDNWIKYEEIIKNDRLVYSHGGKVEEATVAFHVTVTFEDQGAEKTLLTMKSIFPTAEARDLVVKNYGAVEGGRQTLSRLAEHLDQMQKSKTVEPFIISRTFNAPVGLMFKMWSEPQHLQHWWGPKGSQITHTKMDFRVGGVCHYCMKNPEMGELWGKIAYREIVKPEKIVWVNMFSDKDGGTTRHPMAPNWPAEMLTVVTLAQKNEKTTVTIQWTPLNATDEENKTFEAGRSSMNQGWSGSLDQLEEYVKKNL